MRGPPGSQNHRMRAVLADAMCNAIAKIAPHGGRRNETNALRTSERSRMRTTAYCDGTMVFRTVVGAPDRNRVSFGQEPQEGTKRVGY